MAPTTTEACRSKPQEASARAAYDVRRAQLRAGQATVAELLAAEAALYRARLTALDAEVQRRLAAVALSHAAGAL